MKEEPLLLVGLMIKRGTEKEGWYTLERPCKKWSSVTAVTSGPCSGCSAATKQGYCNMITVSSKWRVSHDPQEPGQFAASSCTNPYKRAVLHASLGACCYRMESTDMAPQTTPWADPVKHCWATDYDMYQGETVASKQMIDRVNNNLGRCAFPFAAAEPHRLERESAQSAKMVDLLHFSSMKGLAQVVVCH